ncbi:MAG: AAA family ATPase [Candidatus Sedimenticola sp. 6PFRAG7]
MRISRLRVKNFRSVEDLDIPLPQICALVGPNNAGKTNLLEAIRRVLGTSWVSVSSFSQDDITYRDENRDIEVWCTMEPPIQYQKFINAPVTDIHTLHFQYTRYKIGEQKGKPRFEQKCLDKKDKDITVLASAPKKGQQHKYQRLVGIPGEVRDQVPLIHIGTNRSLKEQLPGARYSLLRQMFQEINRNLQDPSQTVTVKQDDGTEADIPRIDRFRELMVSAMELLKTDEFVAVERSIKRNALRQLGFDPDTDTDKLDLYFTPMDTFDFYKSLDLLVTEGGFSISAREMGGGVQNAIVLAILQAFEETRKQGAILLIEEPEMFLHPQMQRSLYKTLRRIGETNQIIYTTHSPHFVSVPEYKEVLMVRKGDEGTKAFLSSLPIDDKRREKLVKELDPERGELFFARQVLIVEGDTEKLAFPVYAGKLDIDLDREGATIVEVGGKRNIMEFAQIAISFGIPTGIVYDSDSSDFSDQKEEEAFNAELDALAKKNGSVKIWRFEKNYEDHLRQALGERKYNELCQKFPKTGKPTRARLIAMEDGLPIPDPVSGILSWLGGKEG